MSALYEIRETVQGDRTFIISTWLKGLRFGSDVFREIDSDSYFKNYQTIIKSLLDLPTTTVKVACLSDDKDVILGYSVLSKDEKKIHFVFVKGSWRKIGVGRALVPTTVKLATHITKVGLSLIRKNGIVFDPFSIS